MHGVSTFRAAHPSFRERVALAVPVRLALWAVESIKDLDG
jgi:hypothetical protein